MVEQWSVLRRVRVSWLLCVMYEVAVCQAVNAAVAVMLVALWLLLLGWRDGCWRHGTAATAVSRL